VAGASADAAVGVGVNKVSSSAEIVIATHPDQLPKRSIISKREPVPGDASDIGTEAEADLNLLKKREPVPGDAADLDADADVIIV
jgi:hypothetical protein